MAEIDPVTGKLILSLCEYFEVEKEEIFGADNMYYTAKKLGRSPTPQEAIMHYIESGGAERFAEKYILRGRISNKEEVEEKK